MRYVLPSGKTEGTGVGGHTGDTVKCWVRKLANKGWNVPDKLNVARRNGGLACPWWVEWYMQRSKEISK